MATPLDRKLATRQGTRSPPPWYWVEDGEGVITHPELVGIGHAHRVEARHVQTAVRRRQVDGRADGRGEARDRLPLPPPSPLPDQRT